MNCVRQSGAIAARLGRQLAIALALSSGCHLHAADLAAPNESGVAMGHLHFKVHDVEANQNFWTDLGGTASSLGSMRLIRFPDIMIILSPGDYIGTSDGAVVNHIAFRLDSLERLKEDGVAFEYFPGSAGVATRHTPEGERVELFDERATNLYFTADGGETDEVAQRHNRPIQMPITSHHLHFYIPKEDVLTAKAWYVEHFGGVAGKRREYEAADLPGINLNFSEAKGPVSPTQGRMVDHIGFEVADLDAFCQQLAEQEISCEWPSTMPLPGIKSAFLTDPWGSYIELTEGLDSIP